MSNLRISLITLVIVFLSLGTMIGCDEPDGGCGCFFCDPDNPSICASPTWWRMDCSVDEYVCAGECTPVDIDCCIDSFGDEVGSCPEDNPYCCEEYDL